MFGLGHTDSLPWCGRKAEGVEISAFAPAAKRALVSRRSTAPCAALVVGITLLLSGAAGLINQVVWQRSLKIFLGGSETVASMVVVLVFMGGLGAGSIWMGRRAGRLRDPLRAFALIELTLAAANSGICAILRSDVSDSVFAFQAMALSIGVPLARCTVWARWSSWLCPAS